jgi:alkylation response protein AidB-like acyl-CoA dehydrogenase
MPEYRPPVNDMDFLLNEVLDVSSLTHIPGFESIDADLVSSTIEHFGDFAAQEIAPLNEVGDDEGASVNESGVSTATGFADAYRSYVEGGWPALACREDDGGHGMPGFMRTILEEMLGGSNLAFAMAPMTAPGTYEVIKHSASEELQERFIPKIVSGEWLTAMSLTEPQGGSALGLLSTRAVPQDDGSYRITGTKMFNSWADHDMTENIVHLVLARLPDAPEGTKGISLFLVPKFLVTSDGEIGERNAFSVGSVEKKLGLHGSPTCVTNFDGATGYLVGTPHRGLASMFIIMNAMRLASGVCAVGMADAAYRNALAYTHERLAGRSVSGAKAPELPGDPIIVHPDVRRMLMTQRAFVEGGRAFCFWVSLNLDLAERHPDPAEREKHDRLVSLLTPVVKSFLSEKAFTSADLALQCFGGHGYIRENGAEQYLRDIRMLQLGEGTSGIQAMDFLGRKVVGDQGRTLATYFATIRDSIEALDGEDVREVANGLGQALELAEQLVQEELPNWSSNPETMAAASVDFMNLVGYLSLGYQWARMSATAARKLQDTDADITFLNNKLRTARFYVSYLLPDIHALAQRIRSGSRDIMSIPENEFV